MSKIVRHFSKLAIRVGSAVSVLALSMTAMNIEAAWCFAFFNQPEVPEGMSSDITQELTRIRSKK